MAADPGRNGGEPNPVQAAAHFPVWFIGKRETPVSLANLTVQRSLADRRSLTYTQPHVLRTEKTDRLFGGHQKQGQAT
jgi:hypothetical protein